MALSELFVVGEEVAEARAVGRPIVALEGSIIGQGLPRPQNLTVGREMMAVVRAAGAVPALIALADGRIHVGADDALLQRLAMEESRKCAARDIPVILAARALGATTVSATLRIAALAGIEVFATGGIGGVHRSFAGSGVAEARVDISADLLELSRRPVAVVCCGAKSILDLPTTLEALEALGVPVLGYRCERFPAFFTADSGLPVQARYDDTDTLSSVARGHWQLGGQGILVCQPPPGAAALDGPEVEGWIARALAEAEAAGVAGSAVTPYLLSAMRRLSGGRTLDVNMALALENARTASDLARSLNALQREGS